MSKHADGYPPSLKEVTLQRNATSRTQRLALDVPAEVTMYSNARKGKSQTLGLQLVRLWSFQPTNQTLI